MTGLVIIYTLQTLLGIGSLVCFILVLVKMFQDNQTALAIVCIVLTCCGIGPLVALVFGWINADKWNIKNIMMIWTGLFIGGIILGIIGLATGATLIKFPVAK